MTSRSKVVSETSRRFMFSWIKMRTILLRDGTRVRIWTMGQSQELTITDSIPLPVALVKQSWWQRLARRIRPKRQP